MRENTCVAAGCLESRLLPETGRLGKIACSRRALGGGLNCFLEARRRNDYYVGTYHLRVGMMSEGKGVVERTLRKKRH